MSSETHMGKLALLPHESAVPKQMPQSALGSVWAHFPRFSVNIQMNVSIFFPQLVTTERRFLKDSLYNEGILVVWDPSVYHTDIPKVSDL